MGQNDLPTNLTQYKKSLWKEKSSDIWSFFCPQCKVPRKVPYRAHPAFRHYVQIGLCAAFFTLLTWKFFTWKGMVSFFPMWIIFEVLYRSRVRAALSCEQCGFDPVLYLVDVKRARREIEDHWKKKFADKGIPYPGTAAEQAKTAAQAAAQAAALASPEAARKDKSSKSSPNNPLQSV